ncbi:hypothetical protein [Mesorhizobium silamurunense]|uniref:hypothetical protein n=1 Tax=Mesorhizobium silamurunense TaxID=499528 RepID=UPI001FEEEA9A|nr:hypothetical protein [Mesorhizobium silamurunense]
MKWVTLIGRQPSWSIRLTDVRCFAQHLAHFDPMTEVPPQDAVPLARRAKLYIYTDAEIIALLAAALSLPPANALRRWKYHCLFGLIAVARLRHSEALDLRRDDVDLDQGSARRGGQFLNCLQSPVGFALTISFQAIRAILLASATPTGCASYVLVDIGATALPSSCCKAGVDCSVIALWLGHAAMETTLTYVHAHLQLKEAAPVKLEPYERAKAEQFRPNDRLL